MAAEPMTDGEPWVERYRPKSLDDIAHQNEVVSTLQNAVKTGRLPHLLFYGPPGSGKVNDTSKKDILSLHPFFVGFCILTQCSMYYNPSDFCRACIMPTAVASFPMASTCLGIKCQ